MVDSQSVYQIVPDVSKVIDSHYNTGHITHGALYTLSIRERPINKEESRRHLAGRP